MAPHEFFCPIGRMRDWQRSRLAEKNPLRAVVGQMLLIFRPISPISRKNGAAAISGGSGKAPQKAVPEP